MTEARTATREDLLALGFTEEQIEELVVRSAISPEMLLRYEVKPLHDAREASRMFGWRKADWEDGRLPAWTVPAILPFQRDPVVQRAKPRRPFEIKQDDGSVRSAKYAQPKKSGTHVFYGVVLRTTDALTDVSIPLWITEGEKKCMAAESAGLVCLALFGVSQWHLKGQRTLHPELSYVAFEGRLIRLAFDRDAITNHQVRAQEVEFGHALERAGAVVRIVRFPEDAPKLDDFLAKYGRGALATLIADADEHGMLPPTADANAPNEWKAVLAQLRLDPATGRPFKETDNMARVLANHPTWQGVFAYDARRERQVFHQEPPFSADVALEKTKVPRAITDTDVARIAVWLVAQPCLGWTVEPRTRQLEAAVALVCEHHRFDDVTNYLTQLKWDNVARLDAVAVTYFGADDSVYARTVVAKWMLSAVARALIPGCQADHVLVLEGEQGIGKSSALRLLAGSDFFSDSLPNIPSRDAYEHCVGPWIIELGELDHMRKSETTALKAFISARAPSFRAAYGRRTLDYPRRCVFAATTNESGYLVDTTGNRRFWPILCTQVDLEALARDRDQLWAEALVRVRGGEAWHLTDPSARAEAEEEQAARQQVDPWYDTVARFIKTRLYVTVPDVLDHLGFGSEEHGYGTFRPASTRQVWKQDQRSANRVAAILRKLGWVRRMIRIDGHRVWRYERLAGVTSVDDSGDTVVTGQVIEIHGLSPVSPVSPVPPGRAGAGAWGAGGRAYEEPRASAPPARAPSRVQGDTSDTGDSGDNEVITSGYPVTSVSPVSPHTGDTAVKPRRRL